MFKPEFEESYYLYHINLMETRYNIIFEKIKVSWKKLFNVLEDEFNINLLFREYYWKWNFLCGMEKILRNLYQHRKDAKKNKTSSKIINKKTFNYLKFQSEKRIFKLLKQKKAYNIDNYM